MASQPSSSAAGLEHPRAVGRQDDAVDGHRERAARRPGGGGDLRELAAGLGGAEAVDDHQGREVLEERLLHRRREDGAARQQHRERGQVVGPALQLVEQRPGEGIAHHEQERHPLALDGAPDVGRVEPLGVALQVDRAARVPGQEPDPLAGAVHERRRQQGVHGGRRRGHDVVEGGGGAGTAEALGERVALAPHDALRAARRAPGEQDVEVVGRRRHGRGRRRGRRQRVLVPGGAGEQGLTRQVGHLEEHLEAGQGRAHRCHHRRERAVVHEAAGLAVGEERRQLVGPVAVVDVEGGGACLERAEHGFEVLVAVVTGDGHVVLTGLPGGEVGALRVAAQPDAVEVVGQAAGPVGDLGPGEAAVAEDEGLAIGCGGGDRVVRDPNVHVHERTLSPDGEEQRIPRCRVCE